ncbi:MAG: MATE family efflux transporter [Candidatus Gracilibacteria bacterium]|nr:MATE family efflux transporter [Candidatus Gracilibacteria bacterium]
MKNNKNLEIALNGPIVKSIFALAIPILFANLLQSAYQLTDAFWVGRLGKDAVASVSVSFPITFFMISLGAGFAVAGSTFIAQYVGAKNFKMVNHVAAQTLLMVVIISLFVGTIGYIISPFLLSLMGVTNAVFSDALNFLRISFIGMIFVFSFSMFQSIMRGLGEVKMPMKIIFGTVLLNLIVDPLFIFGYGIFPAMGVAGAAMATLITQGIASIIGLVILLKGNYHIHLKISDFLPDYSYIKKAFFLGLPSSIEMSARSLGMLIMTFLVTSFGSIAVASYGAGGNILQLVMIFGLGFTMATSVLVGQNIGAKNMARASEIAKVSSIISFLFLSFLGLVVFFTGPYLIAFFVPGEETVIKLGSELLTVVSLSFGLIGIQMVMTGIFRAAGNMKTTLVLTLISQLILQFPIAYILSKHTSLGLDGIWYSMLITNIIITIISVLWFMKGDWKKSNLISKDTIMKEKILEDTLIEEGIR